VPSILRCFPSGHAQICRKTPKHQSTKAQQIEPYLLVRAIIRKALECGADFEVCGEAADGTDAVSKAKELSPDLIILDVRMPELNGIEVAGILRYALPRIRIVLVTMYSEDLPQSFAPLFSIDGVFAKSSGLAELTALVKNLLGEGQVNTAMPGETLTAT
jgi:DNA-binding NarL/FixJ family response regulator